ncbi:MAG: exodeoxyribonuclease VII small subunit [Anaerolineae bacterium]|nr:MAG: exodeoxyribonuclease VII small subunit [Anaerolineae bacterium]
MAKKNEDLSFEAAFQELEETVRRLEAGGLSLEEALALYERGQELAALCGTLLEEAELKISTLQPSEDAPRD